MDRERYLAGGQPQPHVQYFTKSLVLNSLGANNEILMDGELFTKPHLIIRREKGNASSNFQQII